MMDHNGSGIFEILIQIDKQHFADYLGISTSASHKMELKIRLCQYRWPDHFRLDFAVLELAAR